MAAARSRILNPSKRRVLIAQLSQCLTDLVLLNLAFHFTLAFRFGEIFPKGFLGMKGLTQEVYPVLEIYMNIVWVTITAFTHLYGEKRVGSRLDEVRAVLRSAVILDMSFLLFIVARGGYEIYSRLFLVYFFVLAPVLMILLRAVVRGTAKTVRNQTLPKRNVVIIGAGRAGERFYRTVSENPNYGYRVLGFLDDNGVTSKVRPMILGKLLDLEMVAKRQTVDEVVIALPKASEETIADLVTKCESHCIRVAVIPNDYAALEGTRRIEQVGEFSIVRMREAPLDFRSNRFLKRSFDVAFSLAIFVFVFPVVFLISAIAIKISSRGPILFRQLRTGEDGKSFTCYKFRTMRVAERHIADGVQALPNDSRLTKIGRILRRTSMDELPQFWNVLKGEMSVVGPRPHMLKHTEDYRNIISQYMVRHFVKPGLTGWAQVNGYRGATTNEQMQRRIEHDLYYIENWSFLFDMSIIARTVITVISGDVNAY